MNLIIVLFISAFVCISARDKLEVKVTYKPHNCDHGPKSSEGDEVSIHYTGYVHENSLTGTPGEVFDSSRGAVNKPLRFHLDSDHVIRGLNDGLKNMCPGEKRILDIPSHLGFGEAGYGKSLPGGATLQYDVEMLNIRTPGINTAGSDTELNIFADMDTDENGEIDFVEFKHWTFKNSPNSIIPDDILREVFLRDDVDEDGVVSWDEFTGPKGAIAPY